MPNNSRISLVTGAGGFVGANLVRKLIDQGDQVHVLIRGDKPSWRLLDISNKIVWHKVDLREKDTVRAAVHKVMPKAIFHLATTGVYAGVHVSDSEMIENNVLGLMNLIDAVSDLDYDCFINTGSSAEYGPKQTLMRETDICEPITTYGISKLAATQYASYIAKIKSRPIVTLRLFSPYGYFDDKCRLIPTVISKLLNNEQLVLGNPSSVRDFIFIDDVIDAYLQCARRAVEYNGEVFNIASGLECSVKNIVDSAAQLLHVEPSISWGNSNSARPWESTRWQADISKADRLLGWHPQVSIEEGLSQTISWMRNNLKEYKT